VVSETQLTLLDALQAHADVVRIRTVPGPPAAGTEIEFDESWKAHGRGGGVGVGGVGAGGVGVGGGGDGGAGDGGAGAGGGGGGVAALGSCERVTL
jgi:hypothetical protein